MREYNPYTPGAGFRPTVLAGRDRQLESMDYCLANLQRGFPQRSIVYCGLRGVGKTVLLNTIEEAADNRGMLHAFIEATENRLFRPRLIAALTRFSAELGTKEKTRAFTEQLKLLLRSFRIHYDMQGTELSLGLDGNPAPLTGIYSDDLTEILVQLGRAAEKTDTPVCLFVDELQYLDMEDISALIGALHRCNQLRLPIMMFFAGLPKVKKMIGDAKSYSERLFAFEEVGALDEEGARAVIVGPAEAFGVSYTEGAVREIVRVTECYPYFLQEMCSTVWSRTNGQEITEQEVRDAAPEFLSRLDRGFFSVRYARCSDLEKDFLAAMVRCGELPCAISKVAALMNRSVQAISPTRGKLINKGLIYATGHAAIDFTVPQFDAFLLRSSPKLKS